MDRIIELSADQKISLRLAVKARLRKFEEMDKNDDYVINETALLKELIPVLENTKVVYLGQYGE